MSKNKTTSHFWPSYSDLMTSVFFLMLVMFVLTIVSLRNSLIQLEKTLEDLENALSISEQQRKAIEQIQEAVNQLPTDYFEKDEENKRWILKKHFSPKFKLMDYDICELNDTISLINVGNSLKGVITKLNKMKNEDKYKHLDITYLVVIEGMSSKDNYFDNDGLSYKRALSLYYLWKRNDISFEDSQCEVQIAGSGIRGRGRYNENNQNPEDEVKNQRIIIQIVPKISNIDKSANIQLETSQVGESEIVYSAKLNKSLYGFKRNLVDLDISPWRF